MVSLVIRAADAVGLFSEAVEPEDPNTPLEDWLSRISGTGVVWYHDFESPDEVDQFRWTTEYGNDPDDTNPDLTIRNTVRWNGGDGITHGCLEIFRPSGFNDPSNWWRPFAPLNAASNGRGVDDPAAGGTITLKSFTPTPDGSQTANFNGGYYGNATYHAAQPSDFDGTEYYLQMRVKMDPNRIAGNNEDGGKLCYLSVTTQSNVAQELVTVSAWQVNDGTEDRNYFRMYREASGGTLIADGGGASVSGHQPGTENGSVGNGHCRYDATGLSDGRINNCWYWPLGEWVTILYHVRPGLDDNGDTLLEVFAAREDETEYTQIWRQTNVDLAFGGDAEGHNALICSGYMNAAQGVVIDTAFYHRYCQIIFSQNFIPCPGVSTTLATEAALLGLGESSLPASIPNLDGPAADAFNWQSRWHYDPVRKKLFAIGREQNDNSPTHHIAVFDEVANTWSYAKATGFPNTNRGHTWEMPSYDRTNGRWFSIENGGEHDRPMFCDVDTQDPVLGGSSWNLTTYRGVLETGQNWTGNNAVLLGSGPEITSGSTGMAYHPNLMGAGIPGLVIPSNRGVIAYRFDTDDYPILVNNPTWAAAGSALPTRTGILYCEGLDTVFYYRNGGTARWKITPGPVVTPINNCPIPFHHDVTLTNCAAMVDDPLSRQHFYAVEKFGSRVWKYNAGSDSYSVIDTDHPFTGSSGDLGMFIVCAAYGHGVIIGLEHLAGTSWRVRLYRPPE